MSGPHDCINSSLPSEFGQLWMPDSCGITGRSTSVCVSYGHMPDVSWAAWSHAEDLRPQSPIPGNLVAGQTLVGDEDLELRDVRESAEAVHAELGRYPGEQPAAGDFDRLALHRTDRWIRRRRPVFRRDAVRPQDGKVNDQVGQHVDGPMINGAKRSVPNPAAQQQYRHRLGGRENGWAARDEVMTVSG